jgi:hypothetical protein
MELPYSRDTPWERPEYLSGARWPSSVSREIAESRGERAVAIDLKSLFEIPHGLILQLIRLEAADEQSVTMLAGLLRGNNPLSWNGGSNRVDCAVERPLVPSRLTDSDGLTHG